MHILNRLESAKFREWSWVVIVAGVGFFTDSYAIFAINMVMPMLGIIYYGDNGGVMPHDYETAMSIVTLGGSIIGQIGFGFGADIWVGHFIANFHFYWFSQALPRMLCKFYLTHP